MRSRSKTLFGLAALTLSFSTLAACGDDDGGGSAASSDELDGVSVAVGSKDFTENILLGEMLVLALEARGADVESQINLGGTQVNREALLSGDIDVYPDYNGTGWTEHLGNENPSNDPEELFTKTAEQDLKENDIKWVGRSPFNDTYGFAANADLAEEAGPFDMQSMADYLEANPDATVCLESEFPDRSDGLVLFEKDTGYKIPQKQIKILETGLIYTQTAEGACDFGEIFTTDGRITALDLSVVEDNGTFILYNVSYTWQNEVYQEHADVYDEVISEILEPLDEERMAELNAKRDVDGEDPKDVAQEYLEEEGII